jgi:hypothetical protein
MAKKLKNNVKWEGPYEDPSFFDMWRVRPVGDKDFNSPRCFHFIEKDDAEQFKALL